MVMKGWRRRARMSERRENPSETAEPARSERSGPMLIRAFAFRLRQMLLIDDHGRWAAKVVAKKLAACVAESAAPCGQ